MSQQRRNKKRAPSLVEMERDEKKECPVCFEEYWVLHHLDCQHMLCMACANKIKDTDGVVKCPLCRALSLRVSLHWKDCASGLLRWDADVLQCIRQNGFQRKLMPYLLSMVSRSCSYSQLLYAQRFVGTTTHMALEIAHDLNSTPFEQASLCIDGFDDDSSNNNSATTPQVHMTFLPYNYYSRLTTKSAFFKDLHRWAENKIKPLSEKRILYHGLDLIRTTLITTDDRTMNALQYLVYERVYLDGQTIKSIYVENHKNVMVLVALYSLEEGDRNRRARFRLAL